MLFGIKGMYRAQELYKKQKIAKKNNFTLTF